MFTTNDPALCFTAIMFWNHTKYLLDQVNLSFYTIYVFIKM